MYRGLVERKSHTRFNFQYIPRVGKKTGKEDHRPILSEKQSFVQSLIMTTRLGPIELFFLTVIVAHVFLIGVACKLCAARIW